MKKRLLFAEGLDVTEELGIVKWERQDACDEPYVPDRPPTKKYPKLLMRFKWFRNLVYKTGKHREAKGFPDFVSKTDETRIQNAPFYLDMNTKWITTEKVDGCVTGDSYVTTDQGQILISKIVNQKLPVKVLSYNEEKGICEYKNITDYHKINATRPRYRIGIAFRGKGNREKFIECTDNHKFLTQRGWVRADELTQDDLLMHYANRYDSTMNEILAGCLIGDSSLNSNSDSGFYRTVMFSQSEKQEEYFNYKKRIFGNWFIQERDRISGYGSRMLCGQIISNLATWRFLNTYFPNNGRKKITYEFADMLTPTSLAFWYMDDGSISNRNDAVLNCRAMLNTQGYSLDEVTILKEMFSRKYNIEATIGDKDVYKGYVLIFDVENTERLSALIAPYVCDSMKYKLPQKYENWPCVLDNFTFGNYDAVVQTDILSIEKVDIEKEKINYVYDLEVEDNHNYFAKNILVHNCSATYAMVRHEPKHFWDKKHYEYIVCSRNLRLWQKDKTCYWFVSDKYRIEEVLRKLIEKYDCDWIALQGECISPNVQGNKYKVTEPDLYLFNFITSDNGRIGSLTGKMIMEEYGMKWVPIVETNVDLPKTVDEMLALAHGQSMIGDTIREGLVCRTLDGKQSFKAVDPIFLMKYDE